MSDHRPVSADFVVSVCRADLWLIPSQKFIPSIQCDVLDLSEYETTMKKLNRQVLYMEEQETPPKVSLKPASIDFGAAGYLRSVTKTLEVKNVGKVSAEFRAYCPSTDLVSKFHTCEDPRYPARSGSCLWRPRN